MKRFFKYIIVLISAVMLFIALVGGYIAYYVSHNRDALKDVLIDQINELTVGKWGVDSLSINLWKSYPYVVVNLHNLRLYEDSAAMVAKEKIFAVRDAWFRADIPSLMRKRLNVNDIGFTDLTVNLKKEKNRELNLIEALKLKDTVEVKNHILSFKIEKIDVLNMNINIAAKQYSTTKPLFVDRFLASVSQDGEIINFSDCSLECYGLKFLLDLKFDNDTHCVAVDLSSSGRLLKLKGDINFRRTSIVTAKLNVESSIPLAEYSNGKMSGDLFAKGVVDFDFDMLTYRLVEDRCRLKFGINDVTYNHSFDYAPQVVLNSGIIEYSRSTVVGSGIIMGVGTNKLELNFISGSIADILRKKREYNVDLSVDVKSSDFNPYMIKERLGLSVDSISNENSIKDLYIRLHTSISPENLPISSKFDVAIDDYSAKLSDDMKVVGFKGELELDRNTIQLRDFKGFINDSPTTFSSTIVVNNRDGSEVFERVKIDAYLTTSRFSLKDINIAKSDIVFNNIKSAFSVELEPNADHNAERLKNLNVKFKTFSSTINGKTFSQQSTVEKINDKLKIINSRLEYDNNVFDLNGSIYLDGKNRSDTLNVKTESFDFKQLINDKLTGNVELPNVNAPLVVNLNVKKFKLLDQNLIDLKGTICIEKNRSLLFKDISCNLAGGRVDFTGELSQNAKDLKIKSSIKYSDIDFKDLNIKYKISKNDKERYINENLRGRISGTVDANLLIDKDINIDVARSVINANFTIVNGKLIDFAPIKAASKYFQRSNLNDIRFDTLSNQIVIKSGVISVPRMNISSTLGNYFVSGTTEIEDGNMNFMFEVPWNVIGGAVASRVFGGKSNKKDYIEDDIKKRYVKFYVIGTPENYEVKLRNKE